MKTLLLACLALCLTAAFTLPPALAMGSNKSFSPPPAKNPGKYIPWECSLVTDHTPPLPEEADTIFREARALEKAVS